MLGRDAHLGLVQAVPQAPRPSPNGDMQIPLARNAGYRDRIASPTNNAIEIDDCTCIRQCIRQSGAEKLRGRSSPLCAPKAKRPQRGRLLRELIDR